MEKLTFQAKTFFVKLAWLSELKAMLGAKGAEDFEIPGDEPRSISRSASEERRIAFKKRPSQVGWGMGSGGGLSGEWVMNCRKWGVGCGEWGVGSGELGVGLGSEISGMMRQVERQGE